ncbi:flagellar assembly protein A [candidate division KSB1 bacterium]
MISKIEISGDYLKVYASFIEEEHKEKQEPVKREDIDTLLEEHKITFGIKEDVIEKYIGCKETTTNVIIAEGTPPTVGKSAEVRLLKKPKKKEEVLPKTNENGDIDYISPREGWIVPVNAGEELAVKLAPTQGEPGTNVFNNEIPGIWGNDFDLDEIGGLNTKVDQENLFATVDGFIVQRAKKITIEPIFRIYEDIGPGTGSIDIPKNYKVEIQISKDVKSGFSVKAHKIVVGGCIEDSEVDVNELIIEQGIVGTSEIPIKANKIAVGYINGSRKIYCESIRVVREISNGAQVFCTQAKARDIQGSTVTASEAIWADNINGVNKIFVGIDYKAKMEIERCTKELNKMEEPMEQLKKIWRNYEKRMSYLKELSKKNPQHPLIAKELPQIKEIKDKYDFFQKKKAELEETKAKAGEQMFPSESPFLLVRNGFSSDTSSGSIVEPDTVINIRQEIRKISEKMHGVLFSIIKNELVTASRFNLKELKVKLNRIDW